MSTPGPMLDLERVETYRGPAQILRSISLTLGAGESVCLVGRNGAGKTTTIDTIMGLLSPRSGSIRFKGQDVTRLPAHARARLGAVEGADHVRRPVVAARRRSGPRRSLIAECQRRTSD